MELTKEADDFLAGKQINTEKVRLHLAEYHAKIAEIVDDAERLASPATVRAAISSSPTRSSAASTRRIPKICTERIMRKCSPLAEPLADGTTLKAARADMVAANKRFGLQLKTIWKPMLEAEKRFNDRYNTSATN